MKTSLLEQSIKHWQDNLVIAKKSLGKLITVVGFGVFEFGEFDFNMSSSACPLCRQYSSNRYCNDCPVMKKTNHAVCNRTPYRDLLYALQLREHKKVTKEIVKLVEAEVKFLKSLRPPKRKKAR